ncbi:MAG: hypothetical protein ACP5E2_05960 [Terracidiphilus sp.]
MRRFYPGLDRDLPVRACHWISAIALPLLCVTGYLIGHPLRINYSQ